MSPNKPQQDYTVWKINGIELKLDIHDVDTMEHYEDAFDKMGEAEKSLPVTGKASARVRAYCQIFRNLFDDIFGEGTSQKIFGDVNNSTTMLEVYEDFLKFIADQKKQTDEINNRISDYIMQFSPNRAQRRAQAKKSN